MDTVVEKLSCSRACVAVRLELFCSLANSNLVTRFLDPMG